MEKKTETSVQAEKKPWAKEENGFWGKIDSEIDAQVAKVRPKDGKVQWAIIAAVAILLVVLFKFTLDSDFSAMQKFALSAAMFCVGGEFMRRIMEWDGGFGLIFFRDRSTLNWIDRQAHRFSAVWKMLADIGLVFGFGLLSYFTLGEEQKKDKMRLAVLYGLGIPTLLAFSWFIAPIAISVMMALVQQNDFASATSQIKQAIPGQNAAATISVGGAPLTFSFVFIALAVLLIIGGISGVTTASIIGYGLIVLRNILMGIAGTGPGIAKTAPGGAPLLPGVNLPFVEGILALGVLLVVHELSHGFLARLAKVKLDSAGVVFFGVLPFGAFVDPDEKELEQISAGEHNRIMVAGSAANLITAIFTLAVFIGIFIASADLRLEGWAVTSGPLPHGAIVNAIDGQMYFGQKVNLPASSQVAISTSSGDFVRTTNSTGSIGIAMEKRDKWYPWKTTYAAPFEFISFVLTTLSLVFALNVLVGTVNLLPIPFFDGHHIVKKALGEGLALKIITWACGGAFLLNFLPWLFK